MIGNKRKLIVFIFSFCILFFLFLYIYFKPYNYERVYKINKYTIRESYKKETYSYSFIIEFNNIKIPYIINNSYLKQRKIINDIKEYLSEEETCLKLVSDYLDIYPLCFKNDIIYTGNLSLIDDLKKSSEQIDENYQDINIHYLNDISYLLYNYRGFYIINKKDYNNIILFNKDIYHLDLAYQKDNYLILPNYNDNHYFSTFYIINIETGKIKEISSNYNIYFDGYFLGDFNNYIFYVDQKEKKEYVIDLKKEKINESKFVNIINNKIEQCKYEELKIMNKEQLLNFTIDNGILYLITDNIKIQLSNRKVDRIVMMNSKEVYYLSEDTLYLNNLYEEIPLLTNFEWNFNQTNMIYLYR